MGSHPRTAPPTTPHHTTMAVGKNKRLSKGKKGLKKKTDPFAKKDWYSVKAPSTFGIRDVGKTLVNRTTGLKNANDALKGRIFEVSLADLQKDEDHAFRKVKLRADEVQGKNVLTNFHGLDFTSDKLRSLVRKWQSLIEANVVVKTTDDYLLRLFCCFHQAPTEPGQEDHLRRQLADPTNSQEDDGHHAEGGTELHAQPARHQAHPRGHRSRD